jgi:hypothetical protein
MEPTWETMGDALVAQIELHLPGSVEKRRLSEKLIEFRFTPLNPGGAEMSLIVSPSESIFSAGRGARFELPALPQSESRILSLASAVVRGMLIEYVGRGLVAFSLELADGTIVDGKSKSKFGIVGRRRETIAYEPYSSSQG